MKQVLYYALGKNWRHLDLKIFPFLLSISKDSWYSYSLSNNIVDACELESGLHDRQIEAWSFPGNKHAEQTVHQHSSASLC